MASDGGNRGARGLSVELSTLAGRLRSVSNTSGQGSDYAHLTDVALESGSVSTPKSAGTGGLLSTVDTPGLPSVASPCTTPHDRWHTDNDTREVAMDGKAVPAPKTVVGKLLAAWNAPTSSVAGTVFNISNTVIGAGILSSACRGLPQPLTPLPDVIADWFVRHVRVKFRLAPRWWAA